MNSRERFLSALSCQPLDRPPVWVMRQAGRYLPEYRALKAKHSFVEMVRTPEIAAEVTLQPLRRFPLDAAILFSDILVIPEGLGQAYSFREGGGIAMEFPVRTAADVDRLSPSAITERLDYVPQTLRLLKKELNGEKMLLGFCGAPWTIATYMVEGGSSDEFTAVKRMAYENPALLERLLDTITEATADYLRAQHAAGADAVQIFDSWGAACPGSDCERLSLKWIRRLIASLPKDFPVIVYAKGLAHRGADYAAAGARAVSVDWTVELPNFRRSLPATCGVQGNLDPVLLDTTPEITRAATKQLLDSMRGLNGHIVNLGHGILPTAKPENVAALVDTVVNWR